MTLDSMRSLMELNSFVLHLFGFICRIRSSRFFSFFSCVLFRPFSVLCVRVCVSFSLIHLVFFLLDRFVGEPKALVVVVRASVLFPAFVVCLFGPICFLQWFFDFHRAGENRTIQQKTNKNRRRTTCTTKCNPTKTKDERHALPKGKNPT